MIKNVKDRQHRSGAFSVIDVLLNNYKAQTVV